MSTKARRFRRPRTVGEFLNDPDLMATRRDIWNMLEWYDTIQRKNRWYRRLWRWLRGAPIVNYDPFRLQRLNRDRNGSE